MQIYTEMTHNFNSDLMNLNVMSSLPVCSINAFCFRNISLTLYHQNNSVEWKKVSSAKNQKGIYAVQQWLCSHELESRSERRFGSRSKT